MKIFGHVIKEELVFDDNYHSYCHFQRWYVMMIIKYLELWWFWIFFYDDCDHLRFIYFFIIQFRWLWKPRGFNWSQNNHSNDYYLEYHFDLCSYVFNWIISRIFCDSQSDCNHFFAQRISFLILRSVDLASTQPKLQTHTCQEWPRFSQVPSCLLSTWIWRHFPPGSFGITEFSFGKTLNALLLWLLHPVMAFRSPSVVEWSADSLWLFEFLLWGWQAALSFFWHPFCASGHLVIDCEGSRSAHCGPDMHHLEPSHNMMWISWVQLILSFFFFLFLSLTRIKALNFPWNLDPLHHLHTCFSCSPFVSSWRTGVLSFAYVPEIACTPENPNKHISKSTK